VDTALSKVTAQVGKPENDYFCLERFLSSLLPFIATVLCGKTGWIVSGAKRETEKKEE
jgi:hypothetical protein